MVKRIVRFDGQDGKRAYELLWEVLGSFAPPQAKEDAVETGLGKLGKIGVERKGPHPNPDFVARTLEAPASVELMEAEHIVALEALRAARVPGYALALKRKAVAVLDNAQAVPVEAT